MKKNPHNLPSHRLTFDPDNSPTVQASGPVKAVQFKAGREELGDKANYPNTTVEDVTEAGKDRMIRSAKKVGARVAIGAALTGAVVSGVVANRNNPEGTSDEPTKAWRAVHNPPSAAEGAAPAQTEPPQAESPFKSGQPNKIGEIDSLAISQPK